MKRFEIIIVGCGVISGKWMDYFITRDDVEIKALVDLHKDRISRIKEQYRLKCGEYSSLEDALMHENANLVCDLSFVTAHKDIVTYALKNGCDVLGEKPMCLTLEQAALMLDTVKQTGKRYIVMQNRRYVDCAPEIKNLLLYKLLGTPVYLCANIFVNADMASIRNELPYPQLSDNNIHIFDQARNFLNADPVSCYYHSFNPVGSKYKGDAAAAGIFEFDNGAVFAFCGYNGAEGMHTSWEASWRICCEKGTLIWDGFHAPVYEVTDKEGTYVYQRGELTEPSNSDNSHGEALTGMMEALASGKTAPTECFDNIRSVAMVFAAMESIKQGKKISIKFTDQSPYVVFI